jgi:hypothetical protein
MAKIEPMTDEAIARWVGTWRALKQAGCSVSIPVTNEELLSLAAAWIEAQANFERLSKTFHGRVSLEYARRAVAARVGWVDE